MGVQGASTHMQPMTQFIDHDNARLWFFGSRKSDLFREIGEGAKVHYYLVGASYQACLMGDIYETMDARRIDRYWNDIVAAWYESKDDPDMTLLAMDLADAAIWASTRNPVKFAWEIQHAKGNRNEPDVGARAAVKF